MELFLSNPESLAVVDAAGVIARYIVERDRPATPNLELSTAEYVWRARVRAAAVEETLPLYDPAGFRIEFKPETFENAHVKLADLAQWLVDAHKKVVVLDGMRIKPKQAEARVKSETLKRKMLVKRYRPVWPDIDTDLQEGCRNGLEKAAGLERGYYNVQRVLQWGRQHRRLRARTLDTPVLVE